MMACLCCVNASWAYLNDKDLGSNLTKEQLQEKIRQHQEQEQQAIHQIKISLVYPIMNY